jgi:hypothetical protein
MKKVKSLVIDRRKWGRNNKDGEKSGSYLRNNKEEKDDYGKSIAGKMCCLGFACRAFGISAQKLNDNGIPSDITHNRLESIIPEWLLRFGGDTSKLANINDSAQWSDKQKEAKITKIFAKHGIKVKFTH